jgi:hypothetical protein
MGPAVNQDTARHEWAQSTLWQSYQQCRRCHAVRRANPAPHGPLWLYSDDPRRLGYLMWTSAHPCEPQPVEA